jgi:hypothetical protein
VLHGQPTHVGLVDDRLVQRHGGRAVVAPLEEAIADDRLGNVRRRVRGVRPVGVVEVVAEARFGPVDLSSDRLRVRVEEQLGRVAPQALGRFPGPVDTEPVPLSGADVGQVRMPAVTVDLGQLDAVLVDRAVVLCVAGSAVRPDVVAEQAQFDTIGDAGEQREIRPGTVVVRPEGVWITDPDPSSCPLLSSRLVHRSGLPITRCCETRPPRSWSAVVPPSHWVGRTS